MRATKSDAVNIPLMLHSSSDRWLILVCCTLNSIFAIYIGASTTSMGYRLKDRLGIDNIQYNFIFSCYAFPNIVLPVLGGFFVDAFGVYFSLLVFSLFPLAGSILMTLALYLPNYSLFCFGYFVLAIGGLNTRMAGTVLLTSWFGPAQQGLVMGIWQVGDSIGGILDAIFTPMFLERFDFSVGSAMLVACLLQICRTLVAVWARHIDKRFSKCHAIESTVKRSPERRDFLRAFLEFPRLYVIILLSTVTLFPAVLSFANVSVLFFQTKWAYSLTDSGNLQSVQSLLHMCFAPILGAMSDRMGNRGLSLIAAGLILALAHLILGFTMLTPYVGCLAISFASTLFQCACWPGVAMVVGNGRKGLAFGTLMCACSLAGTLLPICVGFILEYAGYSSMELLFACICIVSVGFSVWLILEDRRTGNHFSRAAVKDTREETPLLGEKRS